MIFDRLPGSSPREKRSGSSAGVVGALPGRSLGRPAPRGRGLGPQSRVHRLYFQGPVFYHPRIYGEREKVTCAFIFGPLFLIFFLCEMPPANTFTQRTPAATARARNTLSSTVSRYSRQRLALLCLCISFVTHCLSPHSSLMRHFWLVLLIFWCLSGENAVEAGWFLNLEDIINGLASCCLSRPLHQRTVFFRWESIRRFPRVSVQRFFIFNVHRRTIFFLRRDHAPETRTAAAAAAAAVH